MKKILFLFIMAAAVGCNSEGSGSSSEDTAGVNRAGVENVNGNLPDTTNSIDLGTQDTTRTDTSHKGHNH